MLQSPAQISTCNLASCESLVGMGPSIYSCKILVLCEINHVTVSFSINHVKLVIMHGYDDRLT